MNAQATRAGNARARARGRGRARLATAVACATAIAALLGALAGCSNQEPVVVSREALGTVVQVTAYGEDRAAVEKAVDAAFDVMVEAAAPIDAYDPGSDLAAFNADPYRKQPMPAGAAEVLDAVERLDVGDAFSAGLLAVSRLYGFESTHTVPAASELALGVAAAGTFRREGDSGSFVRITPADARLESGGELAPGLDFGGAAKGLALDRGRESLRASGVVTAALISSGSSTVTLGTKPDGSVWRVAIEDPRDTDRVLASFAFEGDGALSTSGDYQRCFEVGGKRYHHILDPTTGLPARGLRSLTIAGTSLSGLDSDVLSTALFVRGAERASAYAEAKGLSLYVVNSEGQALLVPAPEASGLSASEEAKPTP